MLYVPLIVTLLAAPIEQTPMQDTIATTQPTESAPPTGFLYRELQFRDRTFPYSIYVPPEYTPEQPWPTILFLHGSGERGNDGFLQTEVGIASAIRRNHRLCPAVVIMPQCPRNQIWSGDMLTMALRCIEHTSNEYHLDPDRLYVTGLSLGGAGTWLLAAQLPEVFAAAAPVCGFIGPLNEPPPADQLQQLATATRNLPIWCFHGANDESVPVQRAREIVAAIRNAGGNIKYDEFPNGRHNVWDRTYRDRRFWNWLLAQNRSRNAPDDQPAGD